ncbi:MAG: DNA polymerase III subunit beta, partial [bacterium]
NRELLLIFPKQVLSRIIQLTGSFPSTIVPYAEQSFLRMLLQKNQMIFEGFGEESGVRYYLPLQSDIFKVQGNVEEREYYLISEGMRELIEKMGDEVILDLGSKEEVVIRSGKAKYTSRALNAEEFPEFPYEFKEKEGCWTVRSDVLAKALKKTIFTLGSEQNIEYSNVLLLHFHPEKIVHPEGGPVVRLVTTDAFRLCLYEIPLAEEGKEEKYYLDGSAIKILHRILPAREETMEIYMYDRYSACVLPQMHYYINQVQRNFPNYEVILDREMPNRVVFEREALSKHLSRVDIWAKMQTRPYTVLFSIHPDNVEISTEPEQIGPAYEELPCKLEGAPLKIALNSRYILEYINTLQSEKVVFLYKDASSVCCWYPEDEPQSRYYLMPVRHSAVEE